MGGEFIICMKYKSFLFSILLIVAGLSLYNFPEKGLHEIAKAKIKYDYSVKTEYGKPIVVVQAIDGDTIELINGDHVRYIGIDTPEEVDARKPVQCFALEAAEKNKQLVEGKAVIFYKDKSERDMYGRWLGFVYLEDGTFVNKKLVEEGYAFAYPYKPDLSKSVEIKAAESIARRSKIGLWSTCKVMVLTSGRRQTNAVTP